MNAMQSEGSRPVVLTSYSQPHVLQQRMKEAHLTHGETVTANLSPVRLEHALFGKTILYFCPMNTVDVTERLSPGDGLSIPPEAKLENLTIPADLKPGLYSLKNVRLFSNGTMQVIATAGTKFEEISYANYDSPEVIEYRRRQEEMLVERQMRREREMRLMQEEMHRARLAMATSNWPF